MKTIRVLISPTGEITIDTKGFKGASCKEASQFLEQALGTKTSEKIKSEFYQQASAEEQVRQQAG